MNQAGSISSTIPVQIPLADVRAAMREDCVTFLSFYLGEELTLEVPDFHETIWQEMLMLVQQLNQDALTEYLRKLFAVPREHAKSTLAKLAVILFLKYTDLSFVLYVSKTNGIAKNAIRDIIEWLKSPQEGEVFGPCAEIKSSETESLWIIDITQVDFNGNRKAKRCIFRAAGTGQQVRGLLIRNRRPQIIVLDDIEDLDNTETPEAQEKLDSWVMGSLLKARDRRAVVIFIGNMIRETTLLARFARMPEWNPTVFGCLVRDSITKILRPLWEGRHTVENLLKEYKEYRQNGLGHIWECEMMNLTKDEVLTRTLDGAIRIPKPLPEDLEAGIIVLDPAFGENSWNDYSAITVHARLKGAQIPAVIDSCIGHWKENIVFDEMMRLTQYWGLNTWGIESEAAQRLYISYFELMMLQREYPKESILMLPLVTSGRSKPSRINAFINSVDNGDYAVAEDQFELMDSLMTYHPESTKKDDLPDSGAYGLIVWAQYGTIITSRGAQFTPMTAAGDYKPVESRGQLRVAI